ncbi:homeobox-domain-containing protein [Obba rivulosa]|uniref:Homeobox-domain-containing protein n=1 Tax=Obba rivulosa TaxID=1052685 RepID=A0A8E2J5K5_9APHY|nr:homeobox-domain-containing protein [Obba rivulosa]
MVPLDSPYSPSALYPVLSHHPQYPNPPSYHALDDDYSSATCVPSLIPPGMDPAHVDMRTFYPYQPNEVKHRRRTTRAQLKVLEDVYTRDTKPNANLRKKLAQELDMTPRGVQVWFQNRRAKTKQQRKKAEAVLSAGTHQPSPNEHTGDGAEPTSPPASPSEEVSPEEPSPEPQVSPAADHALPKTDTSWPPSQNVQLHTSPGFLAPPDLYAMRRPSLPTLVNGSLAAPDMYSVSAHGLQRRGVDRRRSVDHNANASTHALRLAGHPYAHAVSVANGNGSSPHGMYDPSLAHVQEDAAASWQSVTQLPYAHRRPAFPPRHSVPSLFPYHTPQSQPAAPMSQPGGANQHGPAMQQPGADRSPPPPNITQALAPRRSGDASNAPSTLVHPAAIIPHHPRISSQLALPNVNIVRNQHRAFAYSSRPVGAPPPGPLPAPNFSFGDAAGSQGPSPLEASPASSANSSTANLHAPDGAEDAGGDLVYREARDEEESEYSQFSRFGSIASVGGSESSWTSAGSAPQGISVAVVPVGAGAGGAQVEWEEGWTWETAGNWKDGFQYGDRRDSW